MITSNKQQSLQGHYLKGRETHLPYLSASRSNTPQLIFILITMTGILASKAFEKLIQKIVIEVKKELKQ
ncbi:hypothetical protein SRCM100169_02002 [Bacillus siamensis]|nr:hypothetical protein SRCM100169_02002 [Bacillus siamensis]